MRICQTQEYKLITKEYIKVLTKTNLTDAEQEYRTLIAFHPQDAELQQEFDSQLSGLTEKNERTFELIDNPPEEVQLVARFFANKDLISELKAKNSFHLEHLAKYQVTAESLDSYYRYTKFQYECGMYKESEDMLFNHLSVGGQAAAVGATSSSSSDHGALWGRLACRILNAKWADVFTDLQAVKEAIEVRNSSHMDQLRQRAWLMHWGLFLLLSPRDQIGAESLADLFSEKPYLQTLENLCPWLLRYFTAAVILSPNRRKTMLRDLLREIQAMSYLYSDPMTQFLDSLFDQFDFDAAQVKLEECRQLVKSDFFLGRFADRFMHEARMLICEMYCTINRKVDLTMLAVKLQLSEEEAERWMVDIVRGSISGPTVDAKIDSSGKQVLMAAPTKVGHKQIIDASKELSNRSGILSANLEALVKEQAVYIQQIVGR